MPHGIKPIQISTIPLHYSFMFWVASKSSWARMSHSNSPSLSQVSLPRLLGFVCASATWGRLRGPAAHPGLLTCLLRDILASPPSSPVLSSFSFLTTIFSQSCFSLCPFSWFQGCWVLPAPSTHRLPVVLQAASFLSLFPPTLLFLKWPHPMVTWRAPQMHEGSKSGSNS